MKNLGLILGVILSSTAVFAASQQCTKWVKEDAICIFAGEDAQPWRRNCENDPDICKGPRYRGQICDSDYFCGDMKINPNLLETDCTEWVRNDGVRCIDGSEQLVRACQKGGLSTSSCDKKN